MHRTIESLRILAVVSALFASGCTDPGPFANMSASIEVVIDDQAVRAAASLFTGSEPYVLAPGEHLTVGIRDRTIELTYDENNEAYFGRPYFGMGALSDLITTDEQVTVTLARSEDTGTFEGTAPVPFSLQAPAAISFGTDLSIQWSPTATDTMKWYVREHDGIGSSDGDVVADHGMVTVPGAVVATVCAASCTLDVQVQRSRATEAGDVFALGNINVRRIERAVITLTP